MSLSSPKPVVHVGAAKRLQRRLSRHIGELSNQTPTLDVRLTNNRSTVLLVRRELSARAGYDPQALVRYLKTLDAEQGGGGGGFQATHPRASDRIAKIQSKAQGMGKVEIPKVRFARFAAAVDEL